jgi:antitoxin VapB
MSLGVVSLPVSAELAITTGLAYVYDIYREVCAMPAPPLSSKPREARLFRNNRSQAVRIPVDFELPGDRVLISRDGARLIIEPVSKPASITELLTRWKAETPLGPEDDFPDIADMPAMPEDIL